MAFDGGRQRIWRPSAGERFGRRAFALRVAGGLAALAVGGCSRAPAAAAATGGASCTLYPRQTEGPFFLDSDLLRRDITEGRPGTPLALELRVLRADTCAPLEGAVVDVWHCDASGVYSGYAGQLGRQDTRGETFLRGSQVSDADGRVSFQTIYPGWYPGRTTHVHFKVRIAGAREATSQLYFPEDVTAAAYRAAPYAARGQKDTSNAADGVVRFEGMPPLATVEPRGSGYVASLTVAIGGPTQ
jgi:protocatechuate 3,4-dioxygenase beta subunit